MLLVEHLRNTHFLEKKTKSLQSHVTLLGRSLSFCEHCCAELRSCHVHTRACMRATGLCLHRWVCTYVRLCISLFIHNPSSIFVRLTKNLPEPKSAGCASPAVLCTHRLWVRSQSLSVASWSGRQHSYLTVMLQATSDFWDWTHSSGFLGHAGLC